MTRGADMPNAQRQLQDILDAIARSRVAAKRMLLSRNLADDVGVTIAFQAILHNLTVIGDVVSAIPRDVLTQDPETPWADVAAMPELIAPTYLQFDPVEIQSTLEGALTPLDAAVRRLLAAQ